MYPRSSLVSAAIDLGTNSLSTTQTSQQCAHPLTVSSHGTALYSQSHGVPLTLTLILTQHSLCTHLVSLHTRFDSLCSHSHRRRREMSQKALKIAPRTDKPDKSKQSHQMSQRSHRSTPHSLCSQSALCSTALRSQSSLIVL